MKQKIITSVEVAIFYAAIGYAIFTSEWLYVDKFTGLFIGICIFGTISLISSIVGLILYFRNGK